MTTRITLRAFSRFAERRERVGDNTLGGGNRRVARLNFGEERLRRRLGGRRQFADIAGRARNIRAACFRTDARHDGSGIISGGIADGANLDELARSRLQPLQEVAFRGVRAGLGGARHGRDGRHKLAGERSLARHAGGGEWLEWRQRLGVAG
jgi:hypothetical protein